jgi:hypothetical protein
MWLKFFGPAMSSHYGQQNSPNVNLVTVSFMAARKTADRLPAATGGGDPGNRTRLKELN